MIPYGRQNISQADIDAVIDVLKSDFLAQGPAVQSFEEALTQTTGGKYAVAFANATAALHIGCLALDLGPGDFLWTSPITFVASANCGRYCGATVDFVDIAPETFNICPHALEEKLKLAKTAGTLPKIVVVVHMCGQSPDLRRIGELAAIYGFKVIEDASHAIGATYLGAPVGSCTYSDIAVFSFHPVKIITTGEGGAALTRDPSIAGRIERLRSHGITRDPSLMIGESDGPWYYQQLELGYNYRITDIQAALGLSQLARLEEFIERRQAIAARYDSLLKELPVDLPGRFTEAHSSWHLYVLRLQRATDHLAVFQSLRSDGIGVNLHYIPVHLQPYYQRLGFCRGDYPVSEDYYSRAISLPIYSDLDEASQLQVVAAVERAIVS